MDDWASKLTSELILTEFAFLDALLKVVSRIKFIVPQKFPNCTVERIRPGL